MIDQELFENMKKLAFDAMARAHAPLSGFAVGSTVLTPDGSLFPGCNVESIIPSLGICAERAAINHAVVHGHTSFVAVLVVSRRVEPLFPCGACRQYLFEFSQHSGLDTMVFSLGSDGRLESAPLSRLMPSGFGPLDLEAANGICR